MNKKILFISITLLTTSLIKTSANPKTIIFPQGGPPKDLVKQSEDHIAKFIAKQGKQETSDTELNQQDPSEFPKLALFLASKLPQQPSSTSVATQASTQPLSQQIATTATATTKASTTQQNPVAGTFTRPSSESTAGGAAKSSSTQQQIPLLPTDISNVTSVYDLITTPWQTATLSDEELIKAFPKPKDPDYLTPLTLPKGATTMQEAEHIQLEKARTKKENHYNDIKKEIAEAQEELKSAQRILDEALQKVDNIVKPIKDYIDQILNTELEKNNKSLQEQHKKDAIAIYQNLSNKIKALKETQRYSRENVQNAQQEAKAKKQVLNTELTQNIELLEKNIKDKKAMLIGVMADSKIPQIQDELHSKSGRFIEHLSNFYSKLTDGLKNTFSISQIRYIKIKAKFNSEEYRNDVQRLFTRAACLLLKFETTFHSNLIEIPALGKLKTTPYRWANYTAHAGFDGPLPNTIFDQKYVQHLRFKVQRIQNLLEYCHKKSDDIYLEQFKNIITAINRLLFTKTIKPVFIGEEIFSDYFAIKSEFKTIFTNKLNDERLREILRKLSVIWHFIKSKHNNSPITLTAPVDYDSNPLTLTPEQWEEYSRDAKFEATDPDDVAFARAMQQPSEEDEPGIFSQVWHTFADPVYDFVTNVRGTVEE